MVGSKRPLDGFFGGDFRGIETPLKSNTYCISPTSNIPNYSFRQQSYFRISLRLSIKWAQIFGWCFLPYHMLLLHHDWFRAVQVSQSGNWDNRLWYVMSSFHKLIENGRGFVIQPWQKPLKLLLPIFCQFFMPASRSLQRSVFWFQGLFRSVGFQILVWWNVLKGEAVGW